MKKTFFSWSFLNGNKKKKFCLVPNLTKIAWKSTKKNETKKNQIAIMKLMWIKRIYVKIKQKFK